MANFGSCKVVGGSAEDAKAKARAVADKAGVMIHVVRETRVTTPEFPKGNIVRTFIFKKKPASQKRRKVAA